MESPRPPRLRIGITGASGFLGRHVAEAALRAGHEVTGFSRHPDRKPAQSPGFPQMEMREFAPGRVRVDGLDAIVHLAGEPVFGVWTSRKKERILASRRDGTRALVDAMLAGGDRGPRTLVSASAIGFYGDTGERETDEVSPPGDGFLAEVTKVWEREAFRAEQGGIRVSALRFGIVLGPDGGALSLLRPLTRIGLGARLGNGRQWVSWIDVTDAAGLALFALENPNVSGVINAVAPSPLRNRDFTEALARQWHRKVFLSVPAPYLKLALGELSDGLLGSQRIVPRRAMELGYRFQVAALA